MTSDKGYYEYELYVMDMATRKCNQITSLKSYSNNAIYFHKSNKILFVHDINWPQKPQKIQLKTVNLDERLNDNNFKIEKININIKL